MQLALLNLELNLEYNDDNSSGLAGIRQRFSPLPRFALSLPLSAERCEVEAYIQAKFRQSYGASINHFLHLLVALRCVETLSGVAGVSLAGQRQPLFLEQYLDKPIEQELAHVISNPVARRGIAEVGNLVATTRGASRLVFIVLASVLSRAGLDWMVFTATAPLQASLRKLGFNLLSIRTANPDRLSGAGASGWGTYYQYAPQVVAGKLEDAMSLIAGRPLYSAMQNLFQVQIDELAAQLQGQMP